MKRATSTPAGLNVKKITAYLKGQAKSRNAVRITCQGGSVYIFTGYAAFKLPAILYRDVIQPVTMQDAPADGVTIVSSDAGFVVNDPHQLTAAQMFQKFSACKEEVKRTSILQEVEAKGKVWGTFRMSLISFCISSLHVKQAGLARVLCKPFFFQLEIERVDFKSDKVKPRLIGCYAAASASKVSIEYLLPRLCIVFEYPVVQDNRFLGRVDSLFVHGFVSLHGAAFCNALTLHHAGPHIAEQPHRCK